MEGPYLCLGLGTNPQSPPWTNFELLDEVVVQPSQQAGGLGGAMLEASLDLLDPVDLLAELVGHLLHH